MNKNEIKKKIEDYELFRNGLHMISGSDVQAVNLRLSGNIATGNIATCDIKLISEDGMERHNNCRYDLHALGWI